MQLLFHHIRRANDSHQVPLRPRVRMASAQHASPSKAPGGGLAPAGGWTAGGTQSQWRRRTQKAWWQWCVLLLCAVGCRIQIAPNYPSEYMEYKQFNHQGSRRLGNLQPGCEHSLRGVTAVAQSARAPDPTRNPAAILRSSRSQSPLPLHYHNALARLPCCIRLHHGRCHAHQPAGTRG